MTIGRFPQSEPAGDSDAVASFPVSGGLVEGIYAQLRNAIVSGAIAPGHRLREIPLSEQFEVSTTPVREALRQLAADGLVEVLPRRGAVVTSLDPQDVDDFYEIRMLLEAGAARKAAHRKSADYAPVEALMRQMAGHLDELDQVQFNRLDVKLHRALCDLSGNHRLAETAERTHIRIQAVRVRCSVQLPGRPRVSDQQHRAIIEAIQEHDADAAESRVVEHLTSVREAVAEALENLG